MSNGIRYDSLLVRELARELHDQLVGWRLEGVWFDRERLRLAIRARPRRRGADAPSLLWQLHPASGHLTPAPAEPSGSRIPLPSPAIVAGVSAPPDERILIIELRDGDAPAGLTRRVVIELMTNQWNAVAVSADERITAVLRERTTRERTLRPGLVYAPPRATGRPGAQAPLDVAAWEQALAAVAPEERLDALPRLVAWASPQNAAGILGTAAVDDTSAALHRAWQRYAALAGGGALEAVLLHEDTRLQPYVRVTGSGAEADRRPSLLAAFAEAAEHAAATPVGGVAMEEALDAVARRMDAVHTRTARLRAEQAGAADEAQRLRSHADVLLSQLHTVRRGSDSAELHDFEGRPVRIPLDPALSPADNATKLYDAARRRDRAAARIPELLRKAAAELTQLEALAAGIREGTASAEEMARLQRSQPAPGRDAGPLLPYREYRTSRGLEVRVGRGSKANDELTFQHAKPNDIWLHARDVAGAHVILRWGDAAANPSAADIHEAAVLAALFSRARTSGTVPVDWTRRKHVRKPRRAAPGLVIPERVKTVFVEPDPALEEQLRLP